VLPDAEAEGMPKGQGRRWRAASWGEMAHLWNEIMYGFDRVRAGTVLQARIAVCLEAVRPDAAPSCIEVLSDPDRSDRPKGNWETDPTGPMPWMAR